MLAGIARAVTLHRNKGRPSVMHAHRALTVALELPLASSAFGDFFLPRMQARCGLHYSYHLIFPSFTFHQLRRHTRCAPLAAAALRRRTLAHPPASFAPLEGRSRPQHNPPAASALRFVCFVNLQQVVQVDFMKSRK